MLESEQIQLVEWTRRELCADPNAVIRGDDAMLLGQHYNTRIGESRQHQLFSNPASSNTSSPCDLPGLPGGPAPSSYLCLILVPQISPTPTFDMNSTSPSLLTLPEECRRIVLEYLTTITRRYGSPRSIDIKPNTHFIFQTWHQSAQVLRVSQQIHHEASQTLYREN